MATSFPSSAAPRRWGSPPAAPRRRATPWRPFVGLALAAVACGHVDRADPPAAPVAPPAVTADVRVDANGEPPDAPAPGGLRLPVPKEQLYADCRERVELPERDGECASDADCTRSGCSQELCVATAGADGLMSTCEVLPCFQVLGSCGCVAGRCAWALAEPPAGAAPPPIQLPPRG